MMNSDDFGSFDFRTIGGDGLGSEDLFHVAMPDLHVPEPCPIFSRSSCLTLQVLFMLFLPPALVSFWCSSRSLTAKRNHKKGYIRDHKES
jgi:hypothetical protein